MTMRITTLDLLFRGTPGLIASYLVESGGEVALIETGPGSTLPRLREAIRAAGVDEAAIKKVFVTHIHLDHAGAAGWFAQNGATIYCHPSAARHLVDPSKLMDSARQVYGDQMDTLWGEMFRLLRNTWWPFRMASTCNSARWVSLPGTHRDMRGIIMLLSSGMCASRGMSRGCGYKKALICL